MVETDYSKGSDAAHRTGGRQHDDKVPMLHETDETKRKGLIFTAAKKNSSCGLLLTVQKTCCL